MWKHQLGNSCGRFLPQKPVTVPLLFGQNTELRSVAVLGQGVIINPVAGLMPLCLMSSTAISTPPGHMLITKHQDYTWLT